MKPVKVLLVDDEQGFRESVREKLELKGLYNMTLAADAETALNLIAENEFDVAVVDIRMPGMDGITLLSKIKEKGLMTEVIILTGAASIESAIEAIKKGAFHYISKPVKMTELEILIQRAFEKKFASKKCLLQARELEATRKYDELIYRSKSMNEIVTLVEKVAQGDSTVLVEGESGTGKELVAFMIHMKSKRSDKPFVVLDCSTVQENLIESELFGYLKGSFTGATESRVGLVEAADEGTLFIDEIANLSRQSQSKILRMLERRLIRKIGTTKETPVDVRIIAATNKDLNELVKKGEFREDLYYRLNIVKIKIPPLRDRKEDISPIAQYFLAKYSRAIPRKLSSQSQSAILSYSWPGNARELANAIERACLICDDNELVPLDLGLETSESQDSEFSLSAAERRHIQEVLRITNGDKKKASELLGITLRHLYRKLNQYGL